MKQLIKWGIAVATIFIITFSQISAQTTHVLAPVADATSFGPNFHSVSDASIKVDADLNRVGFLRFDLSGINGTIEQADLELTIQGFQGGVGIGIVNVYKCIDMEWSEESVFPSRPSYDPATDQLNTNTIDRFPTIDAQHVWNLDPAKLNTGDFITIAVKKVERKNNFYSINDASTQFHPKLTLVVNESATPTCDDGIQNGDETGVDCGGSCDACPDTGGGESVWTQDGNVIYYTTGNVGIGTSTPDALLTVAGEIHARKVKIMVDAGADFVFQNGYNPPSLEEINAFVKANEHLPGIASEQEMLEEGVDVGKFNIQLLQKIEEMTLYMIDFQEQMKELKEENEQLKKRVKELEEQ